MMDVHLPAWAAPLSQPMRYKALYGGRGSAKSTTIARVLLLKASQRPLRILCARETQKSINESVKALLDIQIEAMGLKPAFRSQEHYIESACGSLFFFSGLHTAEQIEAIKSTEGIDIVWLEEAQRVSRRSLDILRPTVRKAGSEIWFSFNPENEDDPVYEFCVKKPPANLWALKVNWHDNEWLPAELKLEMEQDYARDPEKADWVWGGNTRAMSDAQVLRGRWVVEAFEREPEWHGPYYGADWGFAVDPTVLVRCWVNDRCLYIEHEAYGVGIDIDDTPKLFEAVPGAKKHTIRADSARPETISHMRRHGYPQMLGVSKRQGSVEDGVEYLRSFEKIVIHPRCTNTATEARLWSYKTDRLSGDVLPQLLDKNDHCWDAIRYALDPLIRAGKPGAPTPKPPPKQPDYRPRNQGDHDAWKTV